jgi:AbiV family abortive infection protein
MIPDELKAIVADFIKVLPADVAKEARRIAKIKRQQDRMLPFFRTVAELASMHQLLPADPEELRLEAYLRLVEHTESLWEDSIHLFRQGSFSSSLFLSIVTIEELGKLSVARVQAVAGVPDSCTIKGMGKSKSKLRSHGQKHLMAACAGAVINSRLDRNIGIDSVLNFVEDVESGRLELERQNCLYYEFNGRQHIPRLEVSKERAALLAVVAGELLAEVGAVEPIEVERLLKKVDNFEAEIVDSIPGVIKTGTEQEQ